MVARWNSGGRSWARALFLAIVVIGYFPTSLACRVPCPHQKVDSRLRGAPTLVRERKLIGLTAAEIDEELGPPYASWDFAGWDRTYYLGPDSACVDSTWLVIRFDDNGKVVEAKITND